MGDVEMRDAKHIVYIDSLADEFREVEREERLNVINGQLMKQYLLTPVPSVIMPAAQD